MPTARIFNPAAMQPELSETVAVPHNKIPSRIRLAVPLIKNKRTLADYRSTKEALGWKVNRVKVSKASFNGKLLDNGAGYVMLLGKQSSNVAVTLAHPGFPGQNIVVREILESTHDANPAVP